MELSRRAFLVVSGVAAAGPLAATAGTRKTHPLVAVLATPPDGCELPESAAGYAVALGEMGWDVRRDWIESSSDRPELIVLAAAVTLPNALAADAIDAAWRGATVLVESAAAFAGPASAEAARRDLRVHLGVATGPPGRLWEAGRWRVPYVDFEWPVAVKVRDHSRVVPVEGGGWQPIARVSGQVVGLARPVGRGRVIVLGTPLGPALTFGDSEARTWLAAVVAPHRLNPDWTS